MNYKNWYTDLVDVWRVVPDVTDSLITNKRVLLSVGNPCRIYMSSSKAIKMEQTAANIRQEDKLACDNSVDIKAGDELLIHRGAKLGRETAVIRAFAAKPNYYFEPFGAVMPGLAHQEVQLLCQEIVGELNGDGIHAKK